MVKIFKMRLERFGFEHRLRVPSNALISKFPKNSDIPVQDEEGNHWTFGYRRYPAPPYIFGPGWKNFVRSKGLRDGDWVSLYYDEDPFATGPQFKIQIQKLSARSQTSTDANANKPLEQGVTDDNDNANEPPEQVVTDDSANESPEPGELTEIPKEKVWNAKRICTIVNKQSALPESPECPSLINLNFRGSRALTYIPPSVFNHMSVLEVLDLSGTSIQCLPDSLPKLVALKKLILRDCVIFRELTPLIGELHNLQELDLHGTQIVNLPKEIGNLSKLEILRVSFYGCMDCGKRLQQELLVHPGSISSLSRLTELSIDVNLDDNCWIPVAEIVIEEACSLKNLLRVRLCLPDFRPLLKESIDTKWPMYCQLECFSFTVGQHRRRIINRVPKEAEAQFHESDKCLKFVKGEVVPAEMKGVLSRTTAFYLDHQATATSLSDFGITNMESLEFCLLSECHEIQTVIAGKESSESKELESALKNLKFLHIYYMKNLVSIGKAPYYYECLSGLRLLALHMCPKLSVVFSWPLLINLDQLEELTIEDCPILERIVSSAIDESVGSSDKSVGPGSYLRSLRRVLLLCLPDLVSISSEFHIAPNLEKIGFYGCGKLQSLFTREMSGENLKVIRGEGEWWEKTKKFNELE